jgi:pimeloyl-ACP methyl ester carboxylesterase
MAKSLIGLTLLAIVLVFPAYGDTVVPLANALSPTDFVTLDTRPGVTVSFVTVKPEGDAIAAVVLFAGGAGYLGLSHHAGQYFLKRLKGNFLIRSRDDLVIENFVVVLLDAPSDHQSKKGMLGRFRTSAEHAEDILAVIRHLKQAYAVPVWLSGTSRGSESVTNAAVRLGGEIDGAIVSSSVTVTNKNGRDILELPLGKVSVPVLILAHEYDLCHVTPPLAAKAIKRALANSSNAEVGIFEGGREAKSGHCGAKSAHGFFGIEAQVNQVVAEFIRANSR